MSRWARTRPRYQNVEGSLQPGDLLLVYTDGFPEAANHEDQQLGMEPLEEILLSKRETSAHALLTTLFDRVDLHQAGCAADDDVTAILIQRNHAS